MTPSNFLSSAIIQLILKFLLKNKKVFIVNGLRRSGNHACIGWLINSLEEDDRATLDELKEWHLYISKSRKTLFFNEVNILKITSALRLMLKNYEKLKQSQNIIFSFEDALPREYQVFSYVRHEKIAIKRSLLNVIASRLARATKQAKLGLEKGDMKIDEKFFNRVSFLIDATQYGHKSWDYDKWLTSSEYREEFLSSINLHFDSTPPISDHGGGSSFSGKSKVPSKDELFSRYHNTEWPFRIIEKLRKEPFFLYLSEEEKKFVKCLPDKECIR